MPRRGKLDCGWDGPYWVVEVMGPKTYRVRHRERKRRTLWFTLTGCGGTTPGNPLSIQTKETGLPETGTPCGRNISRLLIRVGRRRKADA
ncbi:hypothetical protein T07_10866 [Trichinella nelsoni]|uniref:Integrase p58-like C-terminal domain-containing protein n=1 Tax=Trichinella nelsoni TaxID=6336 RepID=A0A0V0SF88_9BILA|nr:hypothetical protein T07_10866 [Trichinella nelsoni]